MGSVMKNNEFIVFLLVISLASCALTNEGKVDFRRTNNTQVDISDISQKNKVTSDTQINKDITEINQKTEDKKFDVKSKLIAKNASLGTNSIFDKGDSLSVHLRSAFIKNFA